MPGIVIDDPSPAPADFDKTLVFILNGVNHPYNTSAMPDRDILLREIKGHIDEGSLQNSVTRWRSSETASVLLSQTSRPSMGEGQSRNQLLTLETS